MHLLSVAIESQANCVDPDALPEYICYSLYALLVGLQVSSPIQPVDHYSRT